MSLLLQDYVQRVMPCSEFCWLVLALSFPGYPPYIMLLVPLWIASLYAVLGYLSRQAGNNALWKRFGAGLQQKLVSKQVWVCCMSG